MAQANNLIQIKRTSISGRAANTTTLPNPGELALNMTDGILYSGNGSVVFEIGANNTNVNVSGNLAVKAIIANNSIGSSGQVLFSSGSDVYWGPGAAGYTGSRGDTGFTGSFGATGFTGSVGYVGSKGDVGFVGSRGDIGFTGSNGNNGTPGDTGPPGYTGSQGDLGYTGSFGSTGFTGSIGFTGSVGSLGYTGSVGYVGSKGDTSTANATSQSFTANGSQLTFTLASSVASQNNLVVSVDGLVQVPTTHYSISGTTLSFTSIPIANSTVEARNFENGTGGGGGTSTTVLSDTFVTAFLFGL